MALELLELAPETASRVRERAARDGVTIEELLDRFLAQPSQGSQSAPIKPVAEETSEETHPRVMGILAERQKQYGMPTPPGGFKTLTELFAEWEAEDANMTPEQVEEELRFWEDYKRTRDTRGVEI